MPDENKLRIALVAYLLGFGGSERSIIQLGNEMVERGHDVYLVSAASNNPKYDIDARIHSMEIAGDEERNRVASIIRRFLFLNRALRKIGPDITVHFWYQSVYLCALSNKKHIGKQVYSERADPMDKRFRGLLGFVRSATVRRVDKLVFQTDSAKTSFPKAAANRSAVISNPVYVASDPLNQACEMERRIINIGRLYPQKNQSLLIDAFHLFEKRKPGYILEIYGDGPLKALLQKQITSLNLEKKVFLMGTVNNVAERMRNASLFVLSSDYEGMPNALLEAMAVGLPCVTTNWRPGAAREILDEDCDGMIVPCDSPGELCDAMQVMAEVGYSSRNAKVIRKRYTPAKIYNKWENHFKSLVR